MLTLGEIITCNCRHPDGLFCPICGCGSIYFWADLENWEFMTDEEKRSFEICPCCDYGSKDFPYEDYN